MLDDIDAWFVRFRERGDAAALAAVFDQAAPEILRLAAHLTRDPHLAEDLLQETFLAAIDKAAQFDAERRVLPWLVGILVQLVRRQRRSAARQVDAERLPPRGEAAPDDHAEATELSAALAQALAEVEEPYRPVLALHLGHGLGPHAIAQALGRPPGTVRTQLMRGLELLRRLLPAGLAGSALIAVSPRALAAARAAVLARVPGGAALATGAATVFGGVWMAKNLGLAAAALALLIVGAGVWWWSGTRGATDDVAGAVAAPGVQQAAAPPQSAASPVAAAASRETVAPARATASAPAAALASGALRIRAQWSDHTPAAEVGIRWQPAGPYGELLAHWGTTTAGGDLLLERLAPGSYQLAADRGGEVSGVVRVGETAVVELLIPVGVTVECRTVDKNGAAVAGAMVWLSAQPDNPWDGRVVGTTGGDGALELRDVRPGQLVSARAAGFPWCATAKVEGPAGGRGKVALELFGSGRALRGRVVDRQGRPVADCLVVVGSGERVMLQQDLRPRSDGNGVPGGTVRTDAEGAFQVAGVSAGAVPVWARAPGFALAAAVVALPEDRDGEVQLTLSAGGAVAGQVCGTAGQAVARADVHAHLFLPGPRDWCYPCPQWLAHPGAVTDAVGGFVLAGLTPGPTACAVDAGKLGWARTELVIEDGKQLTWDARLTTGAEIRGVVVDEAGKPMAGWRVAGVPPERGGRRPRQVDSGADGRFVLAGCEPGLPYRVEAQAPRSPLGTGARRDDVLPGGAEIELRVPADQVPSAFVTGVVHDADGRPVPKAMCMPRRAGTPQMAMGQADADGRFRVGPLLAGRCVVRVSHEQHGMLETEVVLAQGETHDVGVLQFVRPGTLVVTLTGPDGKPATGMAALWEPDSPMMGGLVTLKDGVGRSKPLRPGRYFLSPLRGDWPVTGWPVEIKSGEETRLQAKVPQGVKRAVRYGRLSEPPLVQVTFRWRNAAGEVFLVQTFPWDRAEMPPRDYWFAPGTWQLEVTTPSGRKAETTITIPDLTSSSEVLLIRMP